MQLGFPLSLLSLVRCPEDGGALTAPSGPTPAYVDESPVTCAGCGRVFQIREGVLCLLNPSHMHPESASEMNVRNARNDRLLDGTQETWRSAFADELEVRPTLEAVGASSRHVVCEVGCGSGRYTRMLSGQAAAVVALDFSRPGLLVLKRDLEPMAAVALVHADATRPFAAAGCFDRALSTLHSNLPGSEQRRASLQQIASALADDGRAVISMHHYALRDAAMLRSASGRYPETGIFRRLMTARESGNEAAPYFERIRHEYIAVSVPAVPSLRVSRTAARVPLVRRGLGRLMLAIVERPRRRTAVDSLPRVPSDGTAAPSGRDVAGPRQ